MCNVKNKLLKQDIPTIDNLKNTYGNWNESESEDTCIEGTCMKSGLSCIDKPCESVHNCTIDANCNDKEPPYTTPFITFSALQEAMANCGGCCQPACEY